MCSVQNTFILGFSLSFFFNLVESHYVALEKAKEVGLEGDVRATDEP